MNRSIPVFLGYAMAASLVFILTLLPQQFADLDLWGRLSVGALWDQTHHFPFHDVFSYTAPHARWVDHEWLSGLVFYWVLKLGGEGGFLAFKYLLITATLALLFDLHRQCFRIPALYSFFGFLLCIPSFTIAYYATMRAQVFSLLFFIGFIYLLELIRRKKRSQKWLFVLIGLGVFWGNCHGGFILGILVCLIYGLAQMIETRQWKAGFPYFGSGMCIAILLTLLNPYRWTYWPFLLKAWTLDRAFITEWHPVKLGNFDYIPEQAITILGMVVFSLAVAGLFAHEKDEESAHSLPLCLLLGVFSLLMFKAMRFEPFLVLTLLAAFPMILPPVKNEGVRKPFIFPLIASGMALVGILYLNRFSPIWKVIVPDALHSNQGFFIYPVEALQYLKESPYHGNLMTQLDVGEFIYWNLYPRFKVGMDGRYEEVYQQLQARRNVALYHSDNAPKIRWYLDQTRTDFILTTINSPNLKILLDSPKWSAIYQGPYYWILVRKAILSHFPPYSPQKSFFSPQVFTLDDFTKPSDRIRFHA